MMGCLYFNQINLYSQSYRNSARRVRRLGGGGNLAVSARDDGALEVSWNVGWWKGHLGVASSIDRWGQSFATDGAGGEGINYCIPGAYYFTAPDAVRILKGLNPGSPKYCGLEVMSGRHLPGGRGRVSLLTFNEVFAATGFAGSRVLAERRAPGYWHAANRSSSHQEQARCGVRGSRSISRWVQTGRSTSPTGYNPIIQHGEVDFRDPAAATTHPRADLARDRQQEPPHARGASPTRRGDDRQSAPSSSRPLKTGRVQQAKRVMKERAGRPRWFPKLASWVKGLDPRNPETEHQRLEALWTYQTVDVAEPALLKALLDLERSAAGVRRATRGKVVLAVLEDEAFGRSVDAAAGRTGVIDAEPRVRLEAIRSLAQIGGLESASLAMQAIDRPIDTFLEYGLWLTARQLAPAWLPEVQAGRFNFGGQPRRLIFALRAVDSPAIVTPLVALVARGEVPKDLDESVQTLIARLGEPVDLAVVLNLLIGDRTVPEARRASLLNTIVRATHDRKVVPAGDLVRIGKLVATRNDALRETAVRAIGIWKVAALQDRLIELVGAAETSRAVRAAAIEEIVKNGGAEGRRVVESLTESGAPEVQARVLAALLEADARGTTPRVAAWLVRLAPDQSSAAAIVLARVLELRGASALLASALDRLTPAFSGDLAKLCVRQVRASGRDEPGLIAALEKAGRLNEGTKKLSDKDMSLLLTDVARTGDPVRGEAVFRRKDLNCLKCHAIAGAGGQVGPGLESIGASAQPDYLVDSLLEPGKAVKENYHALVVATSDGKVFTGLKLRQTDSELVLRDAEDREVAIPSNSIEDQKTGGSLMPAGLIEELTWPELIDLVRFLSQLGKIGPYSVGTDRVLRRWQVLEATPEVKSAIAASGIDSLITREQSLTWRPVYTTVAGELPLSEWPDAGRVAGAAPLALARTQLEATSPGEVKLTFNADDALSVWVDGRRVKSTGDRARSVVVDLTRGGHTIAVAVDLAHRREGLRCVLEDIPGSPARAQAVLGK